MFLSTLDSRSWHAEISEKTKTFETEASKEKRIQNKKENKIFLSSLTCLLETDEGPGGANRQSNKQTLTPLYCSENIYVFRRML